MAETNPSEVARETLKRLAMQRKPPTPDNYRMIYHEIAGSGAAAEPFPERSLKALAGALPRTTPEQMRFCRQLETAVAEGSWERSRSTLGDLLNKSAAAPPNWSGLIRDVLAQLQVRHAGITAAQKRDALEHVLSASSAPDMLFGRLQSLTRNWSQGVAGEGALATADADLPPAEPPSPAAKPVQQVPNSRNCSRSCSTTRSACCSPTPPN